MSRWVSTGRIGPTDQRAITRACPGFGERSCACPCAETEPGVGFTVETGMGHKGKQLYSVCVCAVFVWEGEGGVWGQLFGRGKGGRGVGPAAS